MDYRGVVCVRASASSWASSSHFPAQKVAYCDISVVLVHSRKWLKRQPAEPLKSKFATWCCVCCDDSKTSTCHHCQHTWEVIFLTYLSHGICRSLSQHSRQRRRWPQHMRRHGRYWRRTTVASEEGFGPMETRFECDWASIPHKNVL